ncbi:hypothetical protein P22_3158 [Propionispora sp. 2/2-37]|uniref:hypothetical protein n=1 Tax=Propionispora sp. 2/2-37 TaxID=1677858 RepID=UPI0006BB610E|nr:hypothetical protein [Propionispora sp. 2/2-37]CUH97032.1 hypothetical protein P22_3158 [Propionispora sp. 2/2-37]
MIIRGALIVKITSITDVNAFMKAVDTCQGKVELVTAEGDRLNLKSKLCQYISMVKLAHFVAASNTIDQTNVLNDIEIVITNPDDIPLLTPYLTVK